MNTGKIFPDSSGLEQDEARILYDYYRRAAEKIVAEEERIESEIKKLRADRALLEEKLSKAWYWFLTIVLFFMYFIKKNELEKQINEINQRIVEFRKQHKSIFRDYKVTRLGVAYVPVAEQVRYEDKSFIVDYTGAVPDSEVRLSMSRQNELLVNTIDHIEQLSREAPVVETSESVERIDTDDYSLSIQQLNQNDYLGDLERSLRTVSFCMDDLETSSVKLPLVLDSSAQLEKLHEFATAELPENAPVVPVFDASAYTDDICKFKTINDMKNSLSTETKQFEDVLKQFITTIAGSVQAVTNLKIASVDKVVLDSNKLLLQLLKAPYNHYSPELEYEEIERIRFENFDYSDSLQGYEPFSLRPSSRVRLNPVTGAWTAEDGSTTPRPFGVHQLYEEIVAPVVQNLMEENRVERLRVYNHIKDQKLSYLNKWHQDTDAFYRANRAESSDIINLMQESLRKYVGAYNTLAALKSTEESMSATSSLDASVVKVKDNSAESLMTFEMQGKEFQRVQQEFEEFIDRIKEDIDRRAEEFKHVEYYDARLRDGYSNEVAKATGEVAALDERRKDLAHVNPLLAKLSDLPPEPNVSDITYEHISINLPALALNTLQELEERRRAGMNYSDDETPDQAAGDSPANEPDSSDRAPAGDAGAEK